MTQRCLQQDAILAELARGATVVTAGERLARALQWAYAETRQAAGQQAWERPRVLSWHAFLGELWSAREAGQPGKAGSSPVPRLLSALQAEALWESVIEASEAASGLLQPRAAAQAAQEAWGLCRLYRLDPERFAVSGSADAEQLAAWAKAFRRRCRDENWLDAADLPQALAECLRASVLALPKRLVFTGFHEWAPQQQQFLQDLQAAGCETTCLVTEAASSANARRVSCADNDQELRAAAAWAGHWLEQNPAARIGIVVHDLNASRERLQRALDDVLCPSASLGARPARPYNLSLGRPLAEVPVIHDALLFLSLLASGQPDFNSASQLLRSPFLRASESERAARVRLELRLREGSEHVPLERWLALARTADDLPELVTLLGRVAQWRQAQSRRLLPSAWAQRFAEALRMLGWPGERTQDSAEHQAVEAFRGTLGELARLDVLAETLDMGQALSRLVRLASQEIFQPAADEVPVQVLGVLEATDLCFDHLWVAGWSDDLWPASPRPNPLIPVSLQRQHHMPHAGAQRELEFAQDLSARLLAAAPEVLVSSPQRDADRELRPSPLIMTLPEIALPQCAVPSYTQLLQTRAPPLEVTDDSQGPALATHAVRGGTGVLKSQAACAFQAFARYRLGARALRVPEPGLDAAERGSLLHAVLYRLFGELTEQAAIAAKDDAVLAAVIHDCVETELRVYRSKWPGSFGARFLELEQERLIRLLREWLRFEREREMFTVEARELDREVRIGSLKLNTRVDRLDRLADGSCVIIDYKTGDAKPAAWLGERPDEPQLPCYAVTAADDISAVLFAVLRPGDSGYRGYARHSGVVPGVSGFEDLKRRPEGCEDWQALLAQWRTVLARLADDFAKGQAQVAPKNRNVTCRVCDLASVCRIDEVRALGEADDD